MSNQRNSNDQPIVIELICKDCEESLGHLMSNHAEMGSIEYDCPFCLASNSVICGSKYRFVPESDVVLADVKGKKLFFQET